MEMRCSDADRDRVAGVLRRHYGEGRLSLAELEERLAEAYAARTREELDRALRELPPLMPPRPDEVGRSLEAEQRRNKRA
jgi:hypothetical protein